MANYITDLQVSHTEADEQQFQGQGFMKKNVVLNPGGHHAAFLWYKLGPVSITKIQVSYNADMAVGLTNAGYTQILNSLNPPSCNAIYLWYFRGSGQYNEPIEEIDVTTGVESEALMFSRNWEKVSCDLDQESHGKLIYIWAKRTQQTYICDVTATDAYTLDQENFNDGYIRMDENTNRGAQGSTVFIWYRQTTDKQLAINQVNVSTNDTERQALQQQKYKIVNVNLNEGTTGNAVYLWYKVEKAYPPLKGITVLAPKWHIDEFKKAGISVIERNLNSGNGGCLENLGVNQ